VWTRDQQSIDYIEQLFGNQGLPVHCKRGVDVAFLLTATKPPRAKYTDDLAKVISNESEPKIGINVSGLLMDRSNAAQSFALTAEYREVLVSFIERLREKTNAKIILVPHVVGQSMRSSSDVRACLQIWNDLKARTATRVIVLPPRFDQNETKWIISKMDWFCGARMHSTVAALSSAVPAAVLAYSDKAKGVFGSCGQEHGVIDLRKIDTRGAVNALERSWRDRNKVRESLSVEIPKVLQSANAQMDEIVEFCRMVQNRPS
jgi:polysaccharide pyruvyl transferase WcaK-like protein